MLTSNFAPRSVAWIATAALAVGWTGASLTTPEPAVQVAPQSGPRPLGKSGASSRAPGQSERSSATALPERLHNYTPVAPLPSRGRNPFVYGVRQVAPAPVPVQVESAPAPVMVAEPPPLAFRLTGIASAFEDGMPALTAIITVNGTMTFVKAGAQLPGGYTVLRVEDTAVVLADATGVTQTLKLP